MQQLEDDFITTRIMGQWLLTMRDADRARSALGSLPTPLRAGLETRQSIWGAEVKTENDAAALWLKDHYAPAASPRAA